MAGQLVIRQEDGYLPPPLHLSSASKAAPSGCSRGCCNAPEMRTPPPSDPCKTPNKTRQGSSPRPHPPATTNTIMRWTGGTRSLRVSARSLVPDHTHTHTHTLFLPFPPAKKKQQQRGKSRTHVAGREAKPSPGRRHHPNPTPSPAYRGVSSTSTHTHTGGAGVRCVSPASRFHSTVGGISGDEDEPRAAVDSADTSSPSMSRGLCAAFFDSFAYKCVRM